jgi:hypothetical protein
VIASRNILRRLEIALGLLGSEPEILRPGPSKLAHDGAKAAVMSTVDAFRGDTNHVGEEVTAPHPPFRLAALCDWVLALVQRGAVNAARKAARNEYMKAFMKRRRAGKKHEIVDWCERV